MQEVIQAAYSAFYAGLHAALYLAAFLVLAAGLFTLVAFGTPHRPAGPAAPPREAGRLPPAEGDTG